MTSALHDIDQITTSEGSKFAPVGRMALAIMEILKANEECCEQDLFCEGFTAQEIREHWHMAHSLACVEYKLMKTSA